MYVAARGRRTYSDTPCRWRKNVRVASPIAASPTSDTAHANRSGCVTVWAFRERNVAAVPHGGRRDAHDYRSSTAGRDARPLADYSKRRKRCPVGTATRPMGGVHPVYGGAFDLLQLSLLYATMAWCGRWLAPGGGHAAGEDRGRGQRAGGQAAAIASGRNAGRHGGEDRGDESGVGSAGAVGGCRA